MAHPDQGLGEQAGLRFRRGRRRQFNRLAPIGRPLVLGDRRGALGFPEFIERLLDVPGRIKIMLKQELNGAFARLAAFSHIHQHDAGETTPAK